MKVKKLIAASLLGLAASSSLFAASSFSGKARIRFGVHQLGGRSADKIVYGFKDKTAADFKFFLLEDTKSRKGEGDIYGEISAYGAVRFKGHDYSLFDWNWYNITSGFKYMFGFNYANIVIDEGKNFKIGITGMNPVRRYATGWEVELDNGNTIASTPFMTFSTAFSSQDVTIEGDTQVVTQGGFMPAINLSYDIYSLSLALDGGMNSYTGNTQKNPGALVLFQANDAVVADGFKISGDVGFFNGKMMRYDSDGDHKTYQAHVLYGAKFDYQKDQWKFIAGVTGNVKVDNWASVSGEGLPNDIFTDVQERNAVEASINFAYDGDDIKAAVDAWFLDNQSLWSDADEPDDVTYENSADLGFVYRNKDGGFLDYNKVPLHKALSIRAMVRPIDALEIVIRAQDVINQGIFGLDLPVHITDDLIITPTFEYTIATNKQYSPKDGGDAAGYKWKLVDDDKYNDVYEGKIQLDYKHDLFTLSTWLRIGAEPHAGDGCYTGVYFKPYVNLSSKKLIDGAQISFVWQKGAFATSGNTTRSAKSGKYHFDNGFGEIYIEARINF